MKSANQKLAGKRVAIQINLLSMVKILSWIVKSLNDLNEQKEVKLLHNKYEVGVIGLVETKIKANKMDKVAKKDDNISPF